jgi:hypothetical protein
MIRSVVGGLLIGTVASIGVVRWALPSQGVLPGDSLRILNQPQPLIQAPALLSAIRSAQFGCGTVRQAVEHGQMASGDVLWSVQCDVQALGLIVHRDGSVRVVTCMDFESLTARRCLEAEP